MAFWVDPEKQSTSARSRNNLSVYSLDNLHTASHKGSKTHHRAVDSNMCRTPHRPHYSPARLIHGFGQTTKPQPPLNECYLQGSANAPEPNNVRPHLHRNCTKTRLRISACHTFYFQDKELWSCTRKSRQHAGRVGRD